MPPEVVYSYWRGLPTEQWDVAQYRMMTIAVPIATQIPQAVGHAYATRRRGEDTVVGTYFGEGATSETDFHSGLNFAGVWSTPNLRATGRAGCDRGHRVRMHPRWHPPAIP